MPKRSPKSLSKSQATRLLKKYYSQNGGNAPFPKSFEGDATLRASHKRCGEGGDQTHTVGGRRRKQSAGNAPFPASFSGNDVDGVGKLADKMKLEATKGGSRKKRGRKQKAGNAPYPKVFEGGFQRQLGTRQELMDLLLNEKIMQPVGNRGAVKTAKGGRRLKKKSAKRKSAKRKSAKKKSAKRKNKK